MLLPHGMIIDRVEKLASDIRGDYPSSTPHLLVVLKGGSEFATDLARALRRLHAYSPGNNHVPFTVDYVRVKSYEGTSSTGTGETRGGAGTRRAHAAHAHTFDLDAAGARMSCCETPADHPHHGSPSSSPSPTSTPQ